MEGNNYKNKEKYGYEKLGWGEIGESKKEEGEIKIIDNIYKIKRVKILEQKRKMKLLKFKKYEHNENNE